MSTQNERLRDAEKTLDTSDLRISFEDACRLSCKTVAEYIKSVRLEGRQFDEAEMATRLVLVQKSRGSNPCGTTIIGSLIAAACNPVLKTGGTLTGMGIS